MSTPELTEEIERLLAEANRHERGIETYVVANGGLHEDDCPGDDTCDCCWKPANEGADAACRMLPELSRLLRAAHAELLRLRAERDKLSAMLKGPEPRRAAFCLRCGESVPYTEGDKASKREAIARMTEHEDQCPMNPLVAEVTRLRAERDRLREVLTELGEHGPGCALGNWEYAEREFGPSGVPRPACDCGLDAALTPTEDR